MLLFVSWNFFFVDLLRERIQEKQMSLIYYSRLYIILNNNAFIVFMEITSPLPHGNNILKL